MTVKNMHCASLKYLEDIIYHIVYTDMAVDIDAISNETNVVVDIWNFAHKYGM